jgi:SAM-dependent methyltransferase
MNIAWSLEALKKLIPVFKQHGIPYFLTDGSLLGAVREGDLLPWDTDLDIAVRYEDWKPEVIPDLLSVGFAHGYDQYNKWRFWMRDVLGEIPPVPPRYKLGVMEYGPEVHIDLAILVPGVGEYSDYRFTVYGDLIRVEASTVVSERELNLKGLKVSIPIEAERYLENQYGPRWRTPNPSYIGSEAHRRILKNLLVVPPSGPSVLNRWVGVRDEAKFWEDWIITRGGKWRDFAERIDPGFPLQDYIAKYIVTGRERILDVGAGPLTYLGKTWRGKTLDIIAVDALANEYNEVLEREQIIPLIKTQFVEVEELTNNFEPGAFDIVHARNMWDHTADPLTAFEQMAAMIKPGGVLILANPLGEGEAQNYQGMHQWNITYSDGDLYIQRPGLVYAMSEYTPNVELEAATTSEHWITAIFRKYQ